MCACLQQSILRRSSNPGPFLLSMLTPTTRFLQGVRSWPGWQNMVASFAFAWPRVEKMASDL